MKPELQQLKDIHLPAAIHHWPVAPGWILLLVLLLILIYSIYIGYCKRQRKKAVKFALAKLKKLSALTKEENHGINIAAEISTLLRRTALYYFPRETIASLSGLAWLKFLNQSGDTEQFTGEVGRLLIEVPYRKESRADLTPLFILTQAWLTTIAKKPSRFLEK